ncbi:hypothetical protein GCM10010873_32380 [Cypionkella aquatica]|uniref:Uncharacterized protein n=1 Tax=Cypionkella aquatica TaxID=1756042 RepID=A0AA37X2J4_9RHOB|nr:hypothetical protein GCM10010873_32380 [Cypionkella aquatica]
MVMAELAGHAGAQRVETGYGAGDFDARDKGLLIGRGGKIGWADQRMRKWVCRFQAYPGPLD